MLEKFLKKLNVNSYLELNDEERATYREWELALAGRKLTDEDVSKFLATELEFAVSRVTDEALSTEVRNYRSAEVRIIQKIQRFLESPQVEKAFTERNIENLINK